MSFPTLLLLDGGLKVKDYFEAVTTFLTERIRGLISLGISRAGEGFIANICELIKMD